MCTKRRSACRIVCDVTLGATVCVTYLAVVTNVQPVNRGFFCDDQSISYPFRPDTVKTWMLMVTSLVVAPAFITLIECYYITRRLRSVNSLTQLSVRADDVISSRTGKRNSSSSFRSLCCRRSLWSASSLIGLFLFGLSVTLLVTEIGKLTVGRLRPHFFNVCQPDFGKLNCSQGYVAEYSCSTGASPKLLQEAKKSFPSGHSSMAVYVAVFFAYYFRRRLATDRTLLLKLVLDVLLCALAAFTCLSRVFDNKHHWSDVLAGAAVGMAVAVWMIVFMRRSVTWDLFQPMNDDLRALSQPINASNSEPCEAYNINEIQE